MTPYDVLGVTPTTPLPEIEAAYRLLLRAHHPDLHQADGPDAIEAAEQTTRQLNHAMAAIRAHHRDGEPVAAHRAGHSWEPAWDAGAREPVPCPYCDLPFERLDAFWHHLEVAHRLNPAVVAPRPKRRRNPRLVDVVGRLRFVPAWLASLLVFASLRFNVYVLLAT